MRQGLPNAKGWYRDVAQSLDQAIVLDLVATSSGSRLVEAYVQVCRLSHDPHLPHQSIAHHNLYVHI